ncbi:hypothetical protein F2P81_021994 [Scophthalmus maximus]|uniref:Uncharacterized protein n=1 Tax=Scophthalmus maximus TaxID=52904 RepID=A0A6A4RSX3_SCOMX|nr:hypothetical protein F2P81_021994 [Scophthalmus maximus]
MQTENVEKRGCIGYRYKMSPGASLMASLHLDDHVETRERLPSVGCRCVLCFLNHIRVLDSEDKKIEINTVEYSFPEQ